MTQENPQKYEHEIEIDEFITLYVYVDPWDPSVVSIEVYNYLEDYPQFDARKFSLGELGVKDVNELVQRMENDNMFLVNIAKRFNPKAMDSNGEVDWYKIAHGSAIYKICDKRGKERYDTNEKVLYIKKLKDGFEFWVQGDQCGFSWVVRQHPKRPEVAVLTFKKHGKEVASVFRDYDSFGVDYEIKSLPQLYEYLVTQPDRATYFITWDYDLEFDRVVVVNESGYEGYDFECCKYEETEEKKDEKNEEEDEERKRMEAIYNEILSKMSNESVKAFDAKNKREVILNELPKEFIEARTRTYISLSNAPNGDRSREAQILEFKRIAEVENPGGERLFVLEVPRINDKLEWKEVSEMKICGFKIEFRKRLIRFKINITGGEAGLIFNPDDWPVVAEIRNTRNKANYVDLKPRKLYLFVCRLPKREEWGERNGPAL